MRGCRAHERRGGRGNRVRSPVVAAVDRADSELRVLEMAHAAALLDLIHNSKSRARSCRLTDGGRLQGLACVILRPWNRSGIGWRTFPARGLFLADQVPTGFPEIPETLPRRQQGEATASTSHVHHGLVWWRVWGGSKVRVRGCRV